MEIYLDNSATTRPSEVAIKAAKHAIEVCYGNPSSAHGMGLAAEKIVREARGAIARRLGVGSGELYFTSGGTESNNLAILGCAAAFRGKGRIITTRIEHKSVLDVFAHLGEMGFEIAYVEVDKRGAVDFGQVEHLVTEGTRLVSVMQVNNETGAILPVNEIGSIVRKRAGGAIFHVDAVQGFCKIGGKIDAELISLSAHKIGGIKGAGALYLKKGTRIKPLFYGGGQEANMRPGTENVPAVAAFGAAVDYNADVNYEYVSSLWNYMAQLLKEKVKSAQIFESQNQSPYILAASIPGIKSEVLVNYLSSRGVYISAGAACSSNRPMPSHTLTAMGVARDVVDSTVRISFSPENTKEELAYVAETIGKAEIINKKQ